MRLTQPEMIQILRKRAGLNQAELGSRAFDTNFDSGRTKIKNIELGIQKPTDDDLLRMAECLDVPVEQLQLTLSGKEPSSGNGQNGIWISQKVLDMFPDLGEYLVMIEKAAMIDDSDLIEYLSERIAAILKEGPAADSESSTKLLASTEGRSDHD